MSLARVNGSRPLVLVELRRRRPWWREPDRVLRAAILGVVAQAVLILAVFVATGHRPPVALYVAQWLCVGASLLVWPLGRPCVRCGRWLRHALVCPRRP
jgi:peptidoglycan/LPS O-acetylase OafA/YrhL